MKNLFTLKLFRLSFLLIAIVFSAIGSAFAQKPAASLEQIRNGAHDAPISPAQWQNGNAGQSNAHYVESHSIGYRARFINLPVGQEVTLTLGYDVRHSSKNAIDFLTNYDRLQPHGQFQTGGSHPTQEVIDPTIGYPAFTVGSPTSTYMIPRPVINNAGDIPGLVWDAISVPKKSMEMWGGTITDIQYVLPGANLLVASSEQRVTVTFTVTAATAVLAWGGHIANRNDWGSLGGTPLSAGGISGSPYHMRLIDWNLSNLGNQDRSLSASAVIAPPGCAISGPTATCAGSLINAYSTSEVADTYSWTIINVSGTTAVFDPAPTSSSTSVNVVVGATSGSYTVKLETVKDGIPSSDVCEVNTTVTLLNEPTYTIEEATLCGTLTAPKLTVTNPVVGLYTLSQTGETDKTFDYDGTNGPVEFTNLKPGLGFNLVLDAGDCSSEATCPTSDPARMAAPAKPVIGKVENKDLSAYPVPFSESVTVEFKAKKAENYVINLYDLQGHLVRELKAGTAKAGEVIKVEVSGSGMAESMYLVRKVSKSGISTVKLLKKE